MSAKSPADQTGHTRFAHESEQRLAELLDFYGVKWEYEPVEFVLEWDDHGRPTSAFRPDFFLPEHRIFLELTTLRQALVTRKNRKVRRLLEMHPELSVKVLYRRDYANLVLKTQLANSLPPAVSFVARSA